MQFNAAEFFDKNHANPFPTCVILPTRLLNHGPLSGLSPKRDRFFPLRSAIGNTASFLYQAGWKTQTENANGGWLRRSVTQRSTESRP
jgi:hypothetical protein